MDRYYLKSEFLRVEIYDQYFHRCNISTLFSYKFSNKLKQYLDGVDIIDDDSICSAIFKAIEQDSEDVESIKVKVNDVHITGLPYDIKCKETNMNWYLLILRVVDPNLDLSCLLT